MSSSIKTLQALQQESQDRDQMINESIVGSVQSAMFSSNKKSRHVANQSRNGTQEDAENNESQIIPRFSRNKF
jgi:hypothetical protein